MSIAFNEKNDDLPKKSRKITVLRSKLKLSYAKFGMPCGYVGGYISCVEHGKVNVSDEFCEKVCTSYGVEKKWLLDDGIAVEPILYVCGDSEHAVSERTVSGLTSFHENSADIGSISTSTDGRLTMVGDGVSTAVDDASTPGDTLSTPGDRLRSVLQDSGLSQREFCSKIGASTSMLGSLMDGRRQITQRYAEKVEKAFHVGADWILYGREECKENPCGDEMIAFLKSSPTVRAIVAKEMEKSSPEA